jgi:hypothetical protein
LTQCSALDAVIQSTIRNFRNELGLAFNTAESVRAAVRDLFIPRRSIAS